MCGVLTACRCDTTSKYIVSTIPLDIPIWGHLTHGITLFQLMTVEENEICVMLYIFIYIYIYIRIAQLIKGYVLFLFCFCLLNGDVTKIEWLLNHYRLWHQDVIVNRCRIDSDTRTLSWTYVESTLTPGRYREPMSIIIYLILLSSTRTIGPMQYFQFLNVYV